jgi:glucosamine--fructose-6-phosphate aminotransferase (isomerizing)
MCGIVGYIGERECAQILIEGLKRLEYRGYDSAGIAVCEGNDFCICRVEGKISSLENLVRNSPVNGKTGIGHTRWATHGKPSEQNAHPHRAGSVVVVHNGIIENHLELRNELENEGRIFNSETDTEILSHLIDLNMEHGKNFKEAVRLALHKVRGSYAIAVMSLTDKERIVVAKNASPLIIGIGKDENFIASDIPAILGHTRNIIILEEGEMAEITSSDAGIFNISDGKKIIKNPMQVNWNLTMAEKGGFKHFLLKEIFEQPRAVVDSIRGRVSLEQGEVILDDLNIGSDFLQKMNRIHIIACGTSFHAALVGKYLMENLAKIPVEVELASEFIYKQPLIDPSELCLAISQSGETIDTINAIKQAKAVPVKTLAICNVVGSSIARECDHVIYTHAGPEISVASTKAFTTQIVILYLLALHFGFVRGKLSRDQIRKKIEELLLLPLLMEEVLKNSKKYREIAGKYMNSANMLYLGRGLLYPVAYEGALKLKEISYIHAEGYAAGEMKHGPIALIDEKFPTVILIPKGNFYEKIMGNLHEIRARNGKIIALATKGDRWIENLADDIMEIPEAPYELYPVLITLPLQLFAYHMADLKGTDVDQPRNLAKSVTVE